ncbi:uncharacterized protein DS421_3g74950 [Arachis hypogaea]|nr:uncharacterized protein DS421_3g74950 [Arachis hypogaea]
MVPMKTCNNTEDSSYEPHSLSSILSFSTNHFHSACFHWSSSNFTSSCQLSSFTSPDN